MKPTKIALRIGACTIAFAALAAALDWFLSGPVREYQEAVQQLDPRQDKEKLGNLQYRALQADPHFEWKTPIAFYGKVVDERGGVVPGTRIHCSWTDLSRKGTSEVALASDARGMFSLTGVRGKFLHIAAEKEGYYTLRTQNQFGFEYANVFDKRFHKPDPNQPVLFHLRRKLSPEPLIYRHIRMPIENDGTPVRLNLFSGKRADDGQIEFRKWNSEEREGRMFDWRAQVRVVDGGFIETDKDFLGEAPLIGYQPEFLVSFSRSAKSEWRQDVDKHVYVAFGTPKKYARAKISIAGAGQLVFIDLWVNPSGSRNLEYDRNKDITQQFDK